MKRDSKMNLASGFMLGDEKFQTNNSVFNINHHRTLTNNTPKIAPTVKMSNNSINAGIQPALFTKVKMANNVLNNGGKMYSFDFEWVGDINGSQLEKSLFSIMEAGIVERTYDNAGNVISKNIVQDLLFGLNSHQEEMFRKLAYSNNVKDPSIRYALDYFARIGVGYKNNGNSLPSKVINGVKTYYAPSVKHYNGMDLDSIITGINALASIGEEGWSYSTLENTHGKTFIGNFINQLNDISANSPIMGHNIITADIANWNAHAKFIPGMPLINSNNPFFIDSYDIIKNSGFDTVSLYSGLGTGVNEGFGKQENLAKATGILSTDYHRATADSASTIDTFMTRSKNYNNMSLFELLENKIANNLLSTQDVGLNSNTTFVAKSGLEFQHRIGNDELGLKIFDEVLDLVHYNDDKRSPYARDEYAKNVIRKGMAYELVGVNEIDLANPNIYQLSPKNKFKSLKNIDKVYSMTLNEIDPTSPTGAVRSSVIYRNSIDEIVQVIQENLLPVDRQSEAWELAINKAQSRRYDDARRLIERSMEISGGRYSGISRFRRINDTINKVNNIKLETGEKAFNSMDEIISTVFMDGSAKDKSELLSDEQFGILTDSGFLNGVSEVDNRRLTNFISTYNYYKNSNQTNLAVTNSIISNAKDFKGDADVVLKANQSAILNGMFSEIFNILDQNGYTATDQTKLQTNRSGYNLKVNLNGDTQYLDATSADNIQRNLKNIAEKSVGGDIKSKNITSTTRLQKMYKDLFNRGLLTKEQLEELSSNNIRNVHANTKKAGEYIHKNFRAMIPNILEYNQGISDEAIILPILDNDGLSDQLKVKNKQLKNIDKKTRKDIRKKGYTQYVSDLDNEINALKTSLEEKRNTRKDLQGRNIAPNKFPKGYSPDDVNKLERDIHELEKQKKKANKYNTIQSEKTIINEKIKKGRDVSKEASILRELTGHGEQLTYNLQEGIVVTDRDGNVVKGGLDSVVNTLKINMQDVYEKAKANAPTYKSTGSITYKKGEKISNNEADYIKKHLITNLGYGQDELDAFDNVVWGSKGVLNQRGPNGESLGMSLFSQIDEHGRQRDYIVFGLQTKLNSMLNIEKTGEFDNDVVQIELPRIEKVNGIELIKRGGVEKINSKNTNFYINTKDLQNAQSVISSANVNIENASSRSIRTLNYIKNDIISAIINNNGQAVASRSNNYINAVLSSAEQGTGYVYDAVEKSNGTNVVKKFVGNVTDNMKQGIIDDSNMINLLPFLYNEDEYVAGQINKLFANNKKYDEQTVRGIINDWISGALYETGDYYKGIDRESINPLFKEYWETNKLGGDELYNRILKTNFINRMNNSDDVYNLIQNFTQYGSQIISDKHVGKGKIALNNISEMTAFGDVTNPLRPALVQTGQGKLLDVTNAPIDYIRRLKQHGVNLGKSIDVYDNLLKGQYSPSGVNNEFVNGITVKFRNIREKDILTNLSEFDNINKNLVDEFRKTFTTYTNNSTDNMTDEYIMQLLQDNLKVFKTKVGTFEQGGAVSPIVSAMYNRPIYHEFDVSKINNIDETNALLGSRIINGDILGYDSDGNAITYKNKRSGIVKGINNGKITIQEDNPAIGSIKVGISAGEKGVLSTFNTDFDFLDDSSIALQFMWDKSVSKDVAMIGNFEIAKHLTGGFAFSDLTYMANNILNIEDNNEVINLLTKGVSFSSDAERANYIQSRKQEYITKIQNILGDINGGTSQNIYTGLPGTGKEYNVLTYIANKDKSKNITNSYAEAMDFIKNSDDEILRTLYNQSQADRYRNVYTVSAVETMLNTQYNSNIDNAVANSEVISEKGYKVTYRGMINFGSTPGKTKEAREFFMNAEGNGFTGEVISKWMHEQVRKTDGFAKSIDMLNSINSTVLLQSGIPPEQVAKDLNIAQEMLVKKINIKDAFVHTAGMTEEDIFNTVFGLGFDIDGNRTHYAIEVDLGNLEITNPLIKKVGLGKNSNETTNKLILPVLGNAYVGEEAIFMPQGVQKNVASLMSEINRLLDSDGQINTTKYVDQRMTSMYKAINNMYIGKDGLFKDGMMSGILNFSGRQLYGKIIEPNYDANGNLVNGVISDIHRKVTLSDGRVIDGVMDIKLHTRQSITEMLGKDIFGDLGYQLYHEGFDQNEEFVKHLKKLGYIGDDGLLANGATYDSIGEQYLIKVGLPGISNRDPDFHPNAQLPVYVRMNPIDDGRDGTAVIEMAHTALKQIGDTDGDNQATALLVRRGSDGRVKLLSKNDEVRKAFEKSMDANSVDNALYWVDESIKHAEAMNELTKLDPNSFIKYMEKNGFESFTESTTLFRIAKARYDKLAIGAVSASNLQIKELAGISLRHNGSNDLSIDGYNDLITFTQLAEQKPISSKKAKNLDNALTLGATSEYQGAVREILTGNKERGLEDIAKAFRDMGLMDNVIDNNGNIDTTISNGVGVDELGNWFFKNGDNIIYTNDLANKYRSLDGITNIEGDFGVLIRGVGSLSELSDTSAIQHLNQEYLINANLSKPSNYNRTLPEMARGDFGNESFVGRYVKNATTIESSNTIKNVLDNNLFYDDSGVAWKVSSMYSGKDGTLFSMTNGDMTYTYLNDIQGKDIAKTTTSYINDRLGLNSLNIAGVESDIVDILKTDNRIGLDLNDLVRNSKSNTIGQHDYAIKEMNNTIIQRAMEIKNGTYEPTHYRNTYNFVPPPVGHNLSNLAIDSEFVSGNTQSDNILFSQRLADLDSYSAKVYSSVDDMMSLDTTLNNLDTNRKAEISARVSSGIIGDAVVQHAKLSNELSGKLITEYTNDSGAFSSSYGWSNNINNAVAGMNDYNAIDIINSFGSAKVGYGNYVGYSLSELSSDQINSVVDGINKAIPNSDEMTSAFLRDNLTAIENYRTVISHADNFSDSNTAIVETVRKLNATKTYNEFTASMANGVESESLRLRMHAMNEQIIAEAEKKSSMKASKIADRVDNATNGMISGIQGKHLLIGAGIIASSILIAGITSGGNLNPDDNAYSQTEEARQNRPSSSRIAIPRQQQANQVYMQPINSSKRVYAKTPYSQVNNNNVTNAMNVAYKGTANKITINNNGGYDSDDRWFEKEMTQQLS